MQLFFFFQNIVLIHFKVWKLDVLTCKPIGFCSSEAVAFVRDQLRQHGDVQVFSLSCREKTIANYFPFCNWFCFFLLIKHLVCVVGLRGTWSESSGIDACHIHLLCSSSFLCPMKSSLSIVLSPLQNTKKERCCNFFLLFSTGSTVPRQY